MHDVFGSDADQDATLARFVEAISTEELRALRSAIDALGRKAGS